MVKIYDVSIGHLSEYDTARSACSLGWRDDKNKYHIHYTGNPATSEPQQDRTSKRAGVTLYANNILAASRYMQLKPMWDEALAICKRDGLYDKAVAANIAAAKARDDANHAAWLKRVTAVRFGTHANTILAVLKNLDANHNLGMATQGVRNLIETLTAPYVPGESPNEFKD